MMERGHKRRGKSRDRRGFFNKRGSENREVPMRAINDKKNDIVVLIAKGFMFPNTCGC